MITSPRNRNDITLCEETTVEASVNDGSGCNNRDDDNRVIEAIQNNAHRWS